MTAEMLDEIRARAEARCAGQVPSVSALILAQEDVPDLLAALEAAQAGRAKAEHGRAEDNAAHQQMVDGFQRHIRVPEKMCGDKEIDAVAIAARVVELDAKVAATEKERDAIADREAIRWQERLHALEACASKTPAATRVEIRSTTRQTA